MLMYLKSVHLGATLSTCEYEVSQVHPQMKDSNRSLIRYSICTSHHHVQNGRYEYLNQDRPKHSCFYNFWR